MFRELLGVCMMVAFVMGTCQIAAHGQSITVTKTKPVGELVAKLKSQDEFERDEAMYELVKLGKAAVPALIGLVDDATGLKATPPEGYGNHYGKNVRGPLGWRAIGVGKQYYPVGLTVNRLAIRALGLISDDRAVEALQEQAKKSSAGLRMGDSWIRAECQRALVGILGAKTPAFAGMRPWHYGEIGGNEAEKRMLAPLSLQTGKHNEFGSFLKTRNPEGVRVIDALSAIGGTAAPAQLVRLVKDGVRDDWKWLHAGMHDLVDFFHAMGYGWDDMFAGLLAAERALGNIGDKEAAAALRTRLDDKNVLVRVTAARALAQLGDKPALPALLKDARWMYRAFIDAKGGYDDKVDDYAPAAWLRLWPNEDQTKVPESGQTWLRDNPSYSCIIVYDGLGYVKDAKAKAFLKKRANEILKLAKIDRFYQVDLLWLASSLKKQGEAALAKKALSAGMKLFEGAKAYDWKLRHFHVAALPALARINDKSTLPAVVRTMLHHPSTWRPGQSDVRDVAWGVYLTLKGRRSPDKPLYSGELLWLY